MSTLQERISHALDGVINPRTGASVLATDMVRDIAVTLDGKVRLSVLLEAADDASLVRDVRQAVEEVQGVSDVRVDVKDAAQSAPATPKPSATGAGRSLPVMDAAPTRKPPAVPQPVMYPHLGRIIAVSSGKGGVGKSTVAVNIAIALAGMGYRVGIMDADIYGPNLPLMLGSPRHQGHFAGVPDRKRTTRHLAWSHRHENHHAVPARCLVGRTGLLPGGYATGHRRRTTLAGAGHERAWRRDCHHSATSGGGRRIARGEDV
jgi:metal-sulfur cluster biosynthetic enzyme